jgi:hypothetical protein
MRPSVPAAPGHTSLWRSFSSVSQRQTHSPNRVLAVDRHLEGQQEEPVHHNIDIFLVIAQALTGMIPARGDGECKDGKDEL